MNKNFKLLITAVVIVLLIAVSISFLTIIPSGHTGVLTTFGKVSEEVLQEGLHVKMPWQVVHKINNRIAKLDVATEAFSKDLQTVSTLIAVEYRVDKSKSYSIFKEVGDFYESILVLPAATDAVTGQQKQGICCFTLEGKFHSKRPRRDYVREVLDLPDPRVIPLHYKRGSGRMTFLPSQSWCKSLICSSNISHSVAFLTLVLCLTSVKTLSVK